MGILLLLSSLLIVGLIYNLYTFRKRLAALTAEQTAQAQALLAEQEKNKSLISQRQSTVTKFGQMAEHLVPFLPQFPYKPSDAHFLGKPLDFLVFDLDEGRIVFVEIKTGKSRESERQRKIKNIIKSGRVFYERIRLDEKGISHKVEENFE